MRAGELRQRIVIQSRVVARNGLGDEVGTWSTLATVWAKVETPSGDEIVDAERGAATLSHKITLRDRSDVTELMRVAWNSRTLEITAVLRDHVGRQMVLVCREIVER